MSANKAMQIHTGKSVFALLATLGVLTTSTVAADERCEISYAVRVEQAEQRVDPGSTMRSFSPCVPDLTYCHTHADQLARAHAEESLASEGESPDLASLTIVELSTQGDCD